MKKFPEYKSFNLSNINKEMLEDWNANHTFEQSLKINEGHPSFVFYEGPPSANGMPGIHHVMARTIKDIFCRFKTMEGFEVKRKAGWDTHGLPVELGVEKSLGITKEDIGTKISVDDYNLACRKEVMKYTKEWQTLTNMMGYWVDTDNPYITYDNKYIESVWWLLSQLYKKGALYKGYTIQPYSPAAGTGLSTHELNQPGCYRDVKDTTATALFEIKSSLRPIKDAWGKQYFAAWTTTPWTLPSNTALCVGPTIKYVAVNTYNPYNGEKITLIIAESRVNAYFSVDGQTADMDSYKQGDKVVPYRIIDSFTGEELKDWTYVQLMPWVSPCAKIDDTSAETIKSYAKENPQKVFEVSSDQFIEATDLAFKVIIGDYVTTEDGTGIVHIAPTFGADDAKVAKIAGIPSLFMITKTGETHPMVDLTGKYYLLQDCADSFISHCVNVELYSQYQGKYVKNAYDPEFNPNGVYDQVNADKAEDLNLELSLSLKQSGKVLKIEKHVHNYPHCWRTDKPVIYYPLDSWFIRTTGVKDRMIELNNNIKWKPASTGSGRFGKWLENLQDWNLSRSRFWGTPLPIWRTNRNVAREEICIESIEQLYNEIEKSVAAGIMKSNPYKDNGFVPGDYSAENYNRIDLHRPYVDDIVLVSASGNPMYRETDLIDVWFDSGSMPFAQLHYPFENKDEIDSGRRFPADFIAEGVDQTRGWFFTLHAIATMVFDKPAYKAVISNGLVLDKDGNKMSKRLGNAVNPFNAIEKFGSDAVRWYMISNSSPWDNLKFDTEGVQEISRKLFATLFNTYSFFSLYANVDSFDPQTPQIPLSERPKIDRWILSLLNSLILSTTQSLDDFEPTKAARAINEFVSDNLSNWYVRLNRKRFWGGEMTQDKLSAYQTLYTCLTTLSKLIAPFAPFFADKLYRDLTGKTSSVHLSQFPIADTTVIDSDLENNMAMVQTITSMILALRRKVNIKVRQPLSTLMIPVTDDTQKMAIESMKDLILSEVNVKDIKYVTSENEVLVKRIKPNYKKLGPKFGKLMKQAAQIISELPTSQIIELEREGHTNIIVEGQTTAIESGDVEIISEDIPGWLVANEGNYTVALDVTLTEDLKTEGLARELVNRIQNLRKNKGYNITDRISIEFAPDDDVEKTLIKFKDYIAGQVLASNITNSTSFNDETVDILDIDGKIVKLSISIAK